MNPRQRLVIASSENRRLFLARAITKKVFDVSLGEEVPIDIELVSPILIDDRLWNFKDEEIIVTYATEVVKDKYFRKLLEKSLGHVILIQDIDQEIDLGEFTSVIQNGSHADVAKQVDEIIQTLFE